MNCINNTEGLEFAPSEPRRSIVAEHIFCKVIDSRKVVSLGYPFSSGPLFRLGGSSRSWLPILVCWSHSNVNERRLGQCRLTSQGLRTIGDFGTIKLAVKWIAGARAGRRDYHFNGSSQIVWQKGKFDRASGYKE